MRYRPLKYILINLKIFLSLSLTVIILFLIYNLLIPNLVLNLIPKLEAFWFLNLVTGSFIYNIIYDLITLFIIKFNLNLYLGDNLVNENKKIKKFIINFMDNNNGKNTPNSTEFSESEIREYYNNIDPRLQDESSCEVTKPPKVLKNLIIQILNT
uniref:Uncharacterized protein n=1 Tax=Arthrobotrys musiformis TaxID=47236 RepID=A0A482EAS4_9PEZI|nr:hypothetical protein [Arthrobotrys musiformis]QBM31524.1 hypothetical protein [Arthrobotrys musiformis]QBM31605.1 hypothetical protein [Arthrobotrys musiformis]QBM31674.1 hypothetical protein [Arthrobotrys musiformis]